MTTTTQRPRLRLPGMRPVPAGTEEYRVAGGGATVIRLEPEDRLTVTDREGAQRCEVSVLSPQGGPDFAAISLRADTSAAGLAALANRGGPGADAVLAALAGYGVDPLGLAAVALFDDHSRPGESVELRAERQAVVAVAAPGGPMAVDRQDPPTDLWLTVYRARVPDSTEPAPPPPLADPLLDIRIGRASATSYEVRAGDYIQVVDIEGRQCSDFLAFDARRLQDGVERGLDATATRTFMGRAYPAPGLFSKFFDRDMQPLVELVRDTVGRHDTFGLACNAKYYEDLGYPGHINCTDNFNAQLDRYAVESRPGWPAINFFYNSRVDDDNVLYIDESWSRPGDYVLLRATTDLVCASSACPDDVDPSNGWNPTEIQVRVYPAKHTFSKAVAHRMTPDAEPVLTRETAFHPRTSALTRRMTEYQGFWVPTSFSSEGAIEEYWAAREGAVVMDLSPLRKFEVLGPDAEALLQATVTRNVRKLSDNQVVYTALCGPTGGMIDDATVYRLGENNFRFVGAQDYDGVWLREQAERLELRVWVKSSTDQLHNLAVQGPRSRDLLRPLIWTEPSQPAFDELTWFRFAVARIGDRNGIPILVSRTGYSGELGYELWCHPSDGPAVWDAVWEAGRPHDLTPLGMDALDMLRIESGLISAGHEFDDQVDPYEAGIGFAVALSAEDDFVGKAALERRKAAPQRRLVGLELEGEETAGHADPVYVGRQQVGVVTSGTRSPVLRKNIALCRMSTEYAEPETLVEVGKLDGHQKRIPAVTTTVPFYDPKKTRPRS